MLTRRTLVSLAVVLGLAAPLSSQAQELTLHEALRRTLQNNPNLAAAREGVVQARIGRDKAWAMIQPQISVGGQFRVNDREIAFDVSDSFDSSMLTDAFTSIYGNLGFIYEQLGEENMIDPGECDELAQLNGFEDCADFMNADGFDTGDDGSSGDEAEPLVVQPKTNLFMSANLTWPLNPRVIPLVSAGERQIDAVSGQVQRTEDQLLVGTVQAYSAVWGAWQAAELMRHQVELLQHHVEQVQAMQSAGVTTADTVMRARLEASKLGRQLREIEAGMRTARRGLAVVMGQAAPDFETVAALPTVEISEDEDTLVQLGLSRRPDLNAARSQVKATHNLKIDAGLQFLPQFAVQASWTWQQKSAGFDDKHDAWWLGVGANLPLWDGGMMIHNARQVSSQFRMASSQVEALEAQIEAEVRDAWDQWQVAMAELPVAQAEDELARETLRLVDVRFQNGTATQLEVLDAQAALQTAELAVLQAQVEAQVAAAKLRSAAGDFGVGTVGE